MRKLRFVPILVILTVLLSSCSLFVAKPIASEALPAKNSAQTGYPSGEIQRPQVMFRGNIYVYSGDGRDLPLPDGFAKVGAVESLNNDPLTFSGEFTGSRVEIGQEIFASSAHIDQIYLAYDSGYAKFVMRTSPTPDSSEQ